MTIWQFIFSFLYTRNWHTGERELSRARVSVFSAALFLILLGLLMAAVLQAPVEYTAGVR